MDIINKAKGTNAVGSDNINMRIIKKLGPHIAPHITHLINCIINKQIYPQILKTSCKTPLLKTDKDALQISSYRLGCGKNDFASHFLMVLCLISIGQQYKHLRKHKKLILVTVIPSACSHMQGTLISL